MTEYSRHLSVQNPLYLLPSYGGPTSVYPITPIWVQAYGASLYVDPITGLDSVYSNTKMHIYVKPKDICVDSVRITFYFLSLKTVVWVSGYTEAGQPIFAEDPTIYLYFQQEYEYNELTRTATSDFTDRFKSIQRKWIENPLYDPNCVEPPPDSSGPPMGPVCPSEYIPVDDTDQPDTSIEMSPYLQISGGTSSVRIIGWSIS
jgi:hypothetical protein